MILPFIVTWQTYFIFTCNFYFFIYNAPRGISISPIYVSFSESHNDNSISHIFLNKLYCVIYQ